MRAESDSEGRRIDFHSLRTTGSTWLDPTRVATSVATKITGHSSESILRRHYHRSSADQVRQAVEALPVAELTPTGTAEDAGADWHRGNRHHRPQPAAVADTGKHGCDEMGAGVGGSRETAAEKGGTAL